MTGRRGLSRFLLTLSIPFALVCYVPVAAQTTAAISGAVTDSTGGALPGVTVTVTNEQTGIALVVVTETDGHYMARNLGLGDYRVEAALQGFTTASRKGIQLTIGREAAVDFTLGVGALTESVEVTGDAPLIDTKGAGVASLVSREQMEDLPLNARDFSQLIDLQAGTVHVQAGGGGGSNAGASSGARISISGARPSANVFVLDGTEIQTAYGTLPSGVGGATLGLEAVQEFKVLSSNYSAQYGRSVGGTVVAATRSGTNSLRGSAYWYHRNEGMDARRYFDVGEKPPFRRYQYGAGVGGPIVKNRMFFFGNYERLSEKLPQVLRADVLTAAGRQGIFPTGTVPVSSKVVPYVNLYPLPNGPDNGDGTAVYTRNDTKVQGQNYTSARVDYQLSSKASVFGRYTRDVSDNVDPQALEIVEGTQVAYNHYVTFEHNRIMSSKVVNQTRFGWTRTTVGTGTLDVNLPDPSLSFVQGRPFGNISISGMTGLNGGGADNTDEVDALIIGDDVTYDSGIHSVHAGGTFTRIEFDRISYGDRYSGQWEFGTIQAFLSGAAPTRMRVAGFNADPQRIFVNDLYATYIQDDIKLRSNLTLNIGTRFEYTTLPSESQGRLANLRNITDPTTTVGEPYYIQPGGFWSPRAGMVWDPKGDGSMSIRGGFGMFHEPLQMKYYIVAMTREPPFWTEIDPSAAQLVGLFPDITSQLERLTKEAPQAIHVFQNNPSNPYSMQGSIAVQKQLSSNMVAEFGWVGTWGVHLPGRKEWAVPVRDVVNGESFFPASANYVNPSFTRLNYYDTHAHSGYNGLRFTLTKRVSNGLHFQGAYTFSKAMDTESATVAGELSGTSVNDPYDPSRDWAPADFDVRHVFTGSASYRLPWGQDMGGVAGAIVSGWQVSSIFSWSGGRPFAVSSNSQLTHTLLRTGVRPDLIAGGNTNPVYEGDVEDHLTQYFDVTQFVVQRRGYLGNVGRNTMIGPDSTKVDLSAVKEFPLGGSRTLQFRVEVFNLFNRVNFGQPSSSLFNQNGSRIATAGRINSQSGTARQGQIAFRFAF